MPNLLSLDSSVTEIREFVFKNCVKPKWGNPLLFGKPDFTIRFADPMFPIICATFVELRLHKMGGFYEIPHFTMTNFKVVLGLRGVPCGILCPQMLTFDPCMGSIRNKKNLGRHSNAAPLYPI